MVPLEVFLCMAIHKFTSNKSSKNNYNIIARITKEVRKNIEKISAKMFSTIL